MADTCIQAPTPNRTTHIPGTFLSIFVQIKKIKTNRPNTDRYYGHHIQRRMAGSSELLRNCTSCGPLMLSIQTHTYYINLIKYDMCFFPFCRFYFSAFLICVRRARTFPFGKRHRQPGSADSVHSVIYIWWPYHKASVDGRARLLQIHIFYENVYKTGTATP